MVVDEGQLIWRTIVSVGAQVVENRRQEPTGNTRQAEQVPRITGTHSTIIQRRIRHTIPHARETLQPVRKFFPVNTSLVALV